MSKLKVTTIANVADSESTDVTNVINGSAKAWVNFDGTGTVAIRDSFNVSSVTDLALGQYRINMSNAMSNANYSVLVVPGGLNTNYRVYLHYTEDPTTSTFKVLFNNAGDTAQYDPSYVNCAVFS